MNFAATLQPAAEQPLLWLIAIGPLALIAAGLYGWGAVRRAPARMNRVALGAALLNVAIAAGAGAAVVAYGSLRAPLIGAGGLGFSLYLDALSATMLCLVAFIGLIVLKYSGNYMDGDPRQVHFTRMLCLTLSAVLLIIVSGNGVQFTLAWIATSLGLHELLIFYPERPAAFIAARKKFLVSRLGEAFLVLAMVLIYRSVGSLDYGTVFRTLAELRATDSISPGLGAAAMLLVCTGLLKSAQFPLHGWLIEVMETPTPVSALLHAGIINAGGFLVLRFSYVITPSLSALDTLAIVGGFTALFGSVVMLTQTSIKVSLAYSTIAQMGFMMLECGLGAFSAALLHIVAHSLYKAHAFLSSGSVIDLARASWTPSPGGKPHPARLLISIAAVLVLTLIFSQIFGATLTKEPGVFALGAVLLLGLVHLVANGIDERPNAYVVGRTVLLACVLAVTYFALQWAVRRLLSGTLPPNRALRGTFGVAIVAAEVLSFAAVVFLQGLAYGRTRQPRWQALYAHIANGLYVNTLANRLVLRFWPNPLETRSASILDLGAGART
jgi:NAD(P)H-quinone oxidoreductase subunit 5